MDGEQSQVTVNTTAEIMGLSVLVNDALATYIIVHNRTFNETASFKSLLKNLFGCGVPMSKLLEESEMIALLWEDVSRQVNSFKQKHYAELPKEEKFYYDILVRYVAAVRKTVAALVDRQKLMAAGSQSRKNNPVSMDAIKQKGQVYLNCIEEYTAIGQELNEASPIIFR